MSGVDNQPNRGVERCVIVSRRVQDVEEFNQAFQGFGISIAQLSKGRCEGEFVAIWMEGVQLIRIKVTCSVYSTGAKTSDIVIFSIPLASPEGPIVSHKTVLPYRSLFGMDATREVNLVTPKQFDLAIVAVSETKLQAYLYELERDDVDKQLLKQNCIQVTDEPYCNLQAYLKQAFYVATVNPDLLRRSQTLLQGDLLPLLINCFSAENSPKLAVYPFRRSKIVQQAEEFIMTHLDRPLTLQDICQAVKVSKSALSYGFQDIFGMSPMVYLKIRRLNGVRYALKRSNPATDTILGITNHYGFWHMGHFARDYKQLFGESPSETLRRE